MPRGTRWRPLGALLLGIFLVAIVIAPIVGDPRENLQTIVYKELSGPIINPLMGWAPWATIKKSTQPHSLVYADLTWREFEPYEGIYDFAAFEKKQQLTRWRQEGKRVVFRFVADVPGRESHIDIPDWLFEKTHGAGEFYDHDYGKGFSPDYANPIYIDWHRKAIKALGERYGKDGFFAFIELGSLGHWGEWHTYLGNIKLPPEDIRNQYVYQYVDAFPGTHLLIRRPFRIAKELGLGLYNDMTADLAGTLTWLDWIQNGGIYLPEEGSGLTSMPNGWQIAPIGGEQFPELSNEQIYDTDLEQSVQLLKMSHTTFIGPGSPYDVESGGPFQAGIDQVMATIGYRLYLVRSEMPRQVLWGNKIDIKLTLGNHGIAPIYYNWPARLYLIDEQNHILVVHPLDVDLRKILPGEFCNITFEMPVNGLKNGTYSIGIAIIDPLTGQPSVRLANENIRGDLIQFLGSFEVRKPFGRN